MQRFIWGLVLVGLIACGDSTSGTGGGNSLSNAGTSSSYEDCENLTNKLKEIAGRDQSLIQQGRDKNPCAPPVATGDAGDYTKDCAELKACLNAHPEELTCDSLQQQLKEKAAKDEALILQGRDKNPCAQPFPTGDAGDYTKDCTDLIACLEKTK